MHNKKMFKVMAYLAYGVSAITTGIFLIGMGISLFDKLIAVMMVCLFEPGKALSFMQMFKPCRSNTIKILTIGLWLVLEIGSVIASTAYMMNMDAKQAEKTLVHSEAYKEIQDKKTSIKSTMDAKQAEISKLQSDKDITISNMISDKNKLPGNYLTAKAELQLKINTEGEKLQKNIDTKSTELLNLQNELNTTTVTGIKPEAKDGYSKIFAVIAGMISSEDNPITADQISFVFSFVIFGLLPELLANVFFWYSQNQFEQVEPNHEIVKPNHEIVKPNRVQKWMNPSDTFKPTNFKIGFQTPEQKKDFSDTEYQKYIEYMIKTATGNVSKGYNTIAGDINIPVETCRSIRRHLERQGFIETQGTKTLILNKELAKNLQA